jgi:hypothetical protein
MRLAGLGPLLLATLLFATCYNPQIVDGGLRCGAGSECPDGFRCSDGFCYKAGSIPPVGGMGGGGGAGGTGGMCTVQMDPYGPFTGCTPQAPMGCDPVCQSGCACGERCKLEGGPAICRAESGPFIGPYEDCDPRADQCRPGAICLQESRDKPACGAHCYRHCRTHEDCPNARCSVDIEFGSAATRFRVCSPPNDGCNPWGPARCNNPNRQAGVFGCYVMSGSFPDIAICDCAGTTKIGAACRFEHECEPGLECVSLGMARTCRRVCKVGAVAVLAGGCPVGETCSPFQGGTMFGYCH